MSLVGFKARNHPQQRINPAVDNRATPPELFDPLNERFHFTLDVAASAENTKCARYFSIENNGLEQSWIGERVWCNPPYSNIEPWLEKAWRENERAQVIVMMLPANRTEQHWWQRWIEPYRDGNGFPGRPLRVQFLAGRQRFIAAGASGIGPNERPPFGVCLLIWSRA